MVESLVDSIDIPVLAGFPDGYWRPDSTVHFSNSAALVLPGRGLTEQYDKRHLVPLSEYFPLPVLNRVDFGQSSFSPGKRPGMMIGTDIPFGVLICFESIFPGPTRELCRLGARYIANITNDQWFGDSAAPQQHFAMNVLRCIENRVGMVRAANTGISGVIDPYGIVLERTETFVQARFVGKVELRRGDTVYTRFGDWIVVVCLIVLAGFVGWALLRGR
jgi:apolipoprotein N-acyltransferase